MARNRYPEGSVERQNALTTLRSIRFVLVRRDSSPWQEKSPCQLPPAGAARDQALNERPRYLRRRRRSRG